MPGVQLDGYFPSGTHTNTNHGWNHDAQFVIRLPKTWNGSLVVAGAPGVRAQYANDTAISDYVLSLGYAYAATDKGNTGAEFFAGSREPGDAIVEWNARTTELTLAAGETVAQHYGRPADEVVAAGVSNGGYLVRWQLENHPELYTRGVDLEGTLWTVDGPNPFRSLPLAIRGYEQQSPELITAAGFDPRSDFLWEYHYTVYWPLTQRIYTAALDPSYSGSEADYDYAQRPEAHQAIERFALTGKIGKPLHTIHGTYDSLLPITQNSDAYAEMAAPTGLHTYQRVEAGNHSTVSSTPTPTSWYRWFPCCSRRSEHHLSRSANSSCSSISSPRLVNQVAMLWQSRSRKSMPFGLPTMSTTWGRSIITIRSPWARTLYGDRSPWANPALANSRIPCRTCSKY